MSVCLLSGLLPNAFYQLQLRPSDTWAARVWPAWHCRGVHFPATVERGSRRGWWLCAAGVPDCGENWPRPTVTSVGTWHVATGLCGEPGEERDLWKIYLRDIDCGVLSCDIVVVSDISGRLAASIFRVSYPWGHIVCIHCRISWRHPLQKCRQFSVTADVTHENFAVRITVIDEKCLQVFAYRAFKRVYAQD
jgi:hypothetical protein